MYSLQCAGQKVEVEGYQFLVGYSYFDWMHSSSAPHVWAKVSDCKAIAAATPESRELALQQLDATSAKRGLPYSIQAATKEALQRASHSH